MRRGVMTMQSRGLSEAMLYSGCRFKVDRV